jgi:hypothetical protein
MRSAANVTKIEPGRKYVLPGLFLVVLFVYGPLLKRHYALDTYVAEVYGNNASRQIDLGRFLSGAVLKLATALGVNVAVYQSYFTFLAICIIAVSIYMLINFFSGLREELDRKSFIALCVSCMISLCNVFVLHWFLFPETVVFMATAMFLSVSALFFLRDGRGTRWIACFVFLFAAISFYQAVGAVFVTFGLLYVSVRRSRQSWLLILRGFVPVFIVYLLAGAINMLLIQWHGTSEARVCFDKMDPVGNISCIVQNVQSKLHNTDIGTAPVIWFLLFVFVVVSYGGFLLSKITDKDGLLKSLFILTAVMVGSVFATMVPHLLTNGVDISPRSVVALMSLPGAICIYVLLKMHILKRPVYLYLLIVFMLVFFSVNVLIARSVEVSRFATNRIDMEIATNVYADVLRYEKESGHTVTKIAFRNDDSPTMYYPGLVCYGNFRAMGRSWTIVPLMSIVSGREFSRPGMSDEAHDELFGNANWDVFSGEQIVIRDDTLYLMLY